MPIIGNRFRCGRSSARARVLGVSLIEVLVSVLLASIGLLALTGANVVSIRYSKMSQYRGTATMLAADLAERMRSNASNLASYAVASDFASQATLPTADSSCEGYTTACSTSIAAYDLANWQRVVRSQLPDGSVFITPSGSVPGADVWLAWRDPAVANDSENNTDSRNNTKECPSGLSLGSDKSIRCSYFRINL
jgi:type IV pilus assembly protein PilV